MSDDDAKRAIFDRRARFVAAALVSAGIAAPACGDDVVEEDVAHQRESPDRRAARPRRVVDPRIELPSIDAGAMDPDPDAAPPQPCLKAW